MWRRIGEKKFRRHDDVMMMSSTESFLMQKFRFFKVVLLPEGSILVWGAMSYIERDLSKLSENILEIVVRPS